MFLCPVIVYDAYAPPSNIIKISVFDCIAVKHWESKGYALKMHAPPGMDFHSISPIF
jgi:hypothetical protein